MYIYIYYTNKASVSAFCTRKKKRQTGPGGLKPRAVRHAMAASAADAADTDGDGIVFAPPRRLGRWAPAT